jgi:hypothetical protein
MFMEEVAGYFELLSQRLFGMTEKAKAMSGSEPLVFGTGFESETLRIERRVVSILQHRLTKSEVILGWLAILSQFYTSLASFFLLINEGPLFC